MATIGSWWVSGFGARPGENVRGSFYANHLRESGRPLGGKLYVTNERVLFCPHLLDAFFSGDHHMIPLAEVQSVERYDPTADAERAEGSLPGGGTQERLRIIGLADEESFFIVSKLDKAAAAIEEALADHRADEAERPGSTDVG